MHLTALLQILILLTVANATPVIAKRILGNRFAYPVDGIPEMNHPSGLVVVKLRPGAVLGE